MEINRQPIARAHEEPVLHRGRGGQDPSIWKVVLSDTPSRQWRQKFNEHGATDGAVSGFNTHLTADTVRFDATVSILASRVAKIDEWIKLTNTEIGF